MKLLFASRQAARTFNATRNSNGYKGIVGDAKTDNDKALQYGPTMYGKGKRYYVSLNSK